MQVFIWSLKVSCRRDFMLYAKVNFQRGWCILLDPQTNKKKFSKLKPKLPGLLNVKSSTYITSRLKSRLSLCLSEPHIKADSSWSQGINKFPSQRHKINSPVVHAFIKPCIMVFVLVTKHDWSVTNQSTWLCPNLRLFSKIIWLIHHWMSMNRQSFSRSFRDCKVC